MSSDQIPWLTQHFISVSVAQRNQTLGFTFLLNVGSFSNSNMQIFFKANKFIQNALLHFCPLFMLQFWEM